MGTTEATGTFAAYFSGPELIFGNNYASGRVRTRNSPKAAIAYASAFAIILHNLCAHLIKFQPFRRLSRR